MLARVVLCLVLSYLDCALGAGVGVHLNIAYRTQIYLPEALKQNPEAFYAGAFYPDAFYNCFDGSSVAENAHWPPFLKNLVEYYNAEYGARGVENYKLKAFIYGVFTHQAADVSWHSLQSHQGLLEVVSETEFDGDIQTAHSYLDTVGDLILLDREFENLSKEDHASLRNLLQKKWDYPIDDILKLYHRLGFLEITEVKLRFCMDRGYSALQGELTTVLTGRTAGKRLKVDIVRSPLTVALLGDYYYGGIDQIVNTLSFCSKELNQWFVAGPALNPWSICEPLFKKHTVEETRSENLQRHHQYAVESSNSPVDIMVSPDDNLYLSAGIPNSKFGSFFKVGNFLDEPSIAISAPFEHGTGSVYLMKLSELLTNPNVINLAQKDVNKISLDAVALGQRTFPSRFGSKLFTWSLNGHDFLVVSEPGISSFNVFLGGKLLAIINTAKTNSGLGENGLKQWDILSNEECDLNSDGWPDLIIGSRFSDDFAGRPQSGLVLALSGNEFYQKVFKYMTIPSFSETPVIDIFEILLHVFETPRELKLSEGFELFGSSFATTEEYILIGVHSVGGVAIFAKNTYEYVNFLSFAHESIDIPKSSRKSSKETALFGYNSILTGIIDNTEWILISSIGYSYNDKYPLGGTVYLYILEGGSFKLKTKLTPRGIHRAFSEKEKYIGSMFGSELRKLSQSVVLIGSSGYDDGRGSLFIKDLKELIHTGNNVVTEYTETELLMTGAAENGFNGFAYDCVENFLYQGQLYVAVSLSGYHLPRKGNDESLLTGSILIAKF